MLVTVSVRRLRERRTRLRASHGDLIGKTRDTPKLAGENLRPSDREVPLRGETKEPG